MRCRMWKRAGPGGERPRAGRPSRARSGCRARGVRPIGCFSIPRSCRGQPRLAPLSTVSMRRWLFLRGRAACRPIAVSLRSSTSGGLSSCRARRRQGCTYRPVSLFPDDPFGSLAKKPQALHGAPALMLDFFIRPAPAIASTFSRASTTISPGFGRGSGSSGLLWLGSARPWR